MPDRGDGASIDAVAGVWFNALTFSLRPYGAARTVRP
jgi:hypothetical protein